MFILESLSRTDEETGRFDGRLLRDTLDIYEKKPLYCYIRTRRELEELANEYRNSGYRYLHLSCHGSMDGIQLTLDKLTFDEFALIFSKKLDNRRLFVSGCDLGCPAFATSVFRTNGGMYSIIGPTHPIRFNQSVPFWSAFHYRMDRYRVDAMKIDEMKAELETLTRLFEVTMRYSWKNTGTNSVSDQVFDHHVPS